MNWRSNSFQVESRVRAEVFNTQFLDFGSSICGIKEDNSEQKSLSVCISMESVERRSQLRYACWRTSA